MRGLVALAISVAVLCAAAAAADTARLELMPLPRSALGPGGAALVLAPDSGVVSNAHAAKDAGPSFTAADMARRGRISGYTLDYVRPHATLPQTKQALLGIQTIAELYRSRLTATLGLAFWRAVTRRLSGRRAHGVTVTLSAFRSRVGEGSYAFELTYRDRGEPLFHVGDVVFRSGSLLGAVFVTATDGVGLRARTLGLADRLDARVRRVVAGRIRGFSRLPPAGP